MSLLSWLLAGNQFFVTWTSLKVCSHSSIWHFLRESKREPKMEATSSCLQYITGSIDQLGYNVKRNHTKLGTQWQPLGTIWGFWPPTHPVLLISVTFWTIVSYTSSESARECLLERLSHQVFLRKEARRQSFWTSNWHPFLQCWLRLSRYLWEGFSCFALLGFCPSSILLSWYFQNLM